MLKSRYLGRDKSIHQQSRKIGVLLTNLGTPDEPTSGALRKYLRQFLSDPRVVEIPRAIWMLILHGIILRVRPKKSAKLYESIWTDKGSPLMVISQDMRNNIANLLDKQEELIVDIAMRYGEPSIPKALNRMQEQGVDKLIILPLYPQYAGPTTASAFDEVTNEIAKWRWIPSLHFINGYHDNPDYIDALANSIKEHFAVHGEPDKLILSYHGMPKHFLDSGDPYFCFCHKTTRLVTEKLNLPKEKFMTTFQSRFGKAEWLKPYTDETLESLPAQGVKNVAIISPAFSADCLETLEELVHENKDIFMQAGGESYRYIPALNDRDDHCAALANIISAQIDACKQQ